MKMYSDMSIGELAQEATDYAESGNYRDTYIARLAAHMAQRLLQQESQLNAVRNLLNEVQQR